MADDSLTFEQKVARLTLATTPQEKAALYAKWANDSELHYARFGGQMPLEDFMKQGKFRAAADQTKALNAVQTDRGWSRGRRQKHIGEIPTDAWLKRPEFSPYLPKKVREKNIRDFLAKYPQFKIG